MASSTVTVTRRQLYEEAWQTPMLRLARKYGLSDVGLAKILKKHRIPHPTCGHWMKTGAGKEVRRTPLPSPEGNPQIEIQSHTVQALIRDDTVRAEAGRLMQLEGLPEAAIEVRPTLRGAHPLVREAHRRLVSAGPDERGLLRLPDRQSFSIHVSRKQFRRALLVMDALIRALLRRGHGVTSGPQGDAAIGAVVLGQHVCFGMEELVDTTDKGLTEEQRECRRRYGYYWRQVMHTPSGRLCFEIQDSRCPRDGLRRRWRDTRTRHIEGCLNDVVKGLVLVAARLKDVAVEREKRERHEAEARRLRGERRQTHEQGLAKGTQLEADAKAWVQARGIREYLEARKREAVVSHGELRPETAAWIEWALEQADRIDPLRESPPSILDTPPERSYW